MAEVERPVAAVRGGAPASVARLRILFVMGRSWPAVGGAEMLAKHVARGLAERHEVTVLALRIDEQPDTRLGYGLQLPPPFEPFTDGPVRYEPLRLSAAQKAALLPTALQAAPVARRYAFGQARRVLASAYSSVVGPAIAAAQSGGADIVHIWSADLVAAAGVRAAKALGARSLITPFLHVGAWGSDPASIAAYRAADCVISLLEAEKQSVVELGVPASQVGICGACTPGVVSGGGATLRAKHGITGPLVLFLGVRRAYKGFDRLLEAAPAVTRDLPDTTFAFVGPGEPIVAPPGVRAVDAGKAEPDELAAWLDAADLLCLPSDHEIFPTSMLEGWSVGTPALVSDLSTLRELIEISGGGRAVQRDPAALARALTEMLSDPAALREYGRRGHEFWRTKHTPEAIAERHSEIYTELLRTRLR